MENDYINSLETETSTVVSTEVSTIDYSEQIADINFSLISLIFFLGILSGLIFGKILWDGVK